MVYDYGVVRTLDVLYDWSVDKMVEVELEKPDDFLKVRETLTRIGILSKRPNVNGKFVLTQSCHLLHKKGKYYIVSFKEMFLLDGRESDLTVSDVERRNLIIGLLEEWGLVKVLSERIGLKAPMSSIRIIPHREKDKYQLQAKYQVGRKSE